MPINNEQLSPDAEYVLGKIPSKFIGWGAGIILFLFLLILILSWFINYPDKIKGSCEFTTKYPPVVVNSRVTGRLSSVLITEGDYIKSEEIIALVETPLKIEAYNYLKGLVQKFDLLIQLGDRHDIISFNPDNRFHYGNLQPYYNNLLNSFIKYEQCEKEYQVDIDISSIESEIKDIDRLIHLNEKSIELSSRELGFADKKYSINQNLFEKEAISKMELIQYEEDRVRKSHNINQLETNRVNLESRKSKLNFTKQKLRFDFEFSRESLLNTLKYHNDLLKTELENWDKQFVFRSPIQGKVAFLKKVFPNQNIHIDEKLFAIIPPENSIIVRGVVSTKGYGKLKKGQFVKLYLDNYPENEFGFLYGILEHKSSLPVNNQYIVNIVLKNNSLVTSRGYNVKYSPKMMGTFEIVTEDKNLFERIFSQFNTLISKI